MNEQLQQAVAALIEKSLKAFESGADFMADQLPDVVQQLLTWHMVPGGMMAFGAVVFAVALIAVGLFALKAVRKYAKDSYDDAAIPLVWGLMGLFIRIPAWWTLVFGLWNLTWLQIWVAPKIFLLEYAARMVTK